MSRTNKSNTVKFESLEGRTLMSGTPLLVAEVANNAGTQLHVTATAANSQITVKQTSDGLVVGNTGGWSQTVTDTVTSLWIKAGAGNSSIVVDPSVSLDATLFGGSGKNVLKAGSGKTVLVSLGSTADTLVGGSGQDAFWTDNNPAEKIQNLTPAEAAAGAVHKVGGFYNAGPTTASGKKSSVANAKALASTGFNEPTVVAGVGYTSFSNDPIFAATGPSANDVFQGNSGDCYLLSVLSSTAKTDATRISNSILNLGDGTAVVVLNKNGRSVFVHEDMKLPTNSDGSLAYAGLGTQKCTWVGLMEKAWCTVRTNANSYAAIDSGWMDETYAVLGAKSTSTYTAASAASLLTLIQHDLANGQSVTYATGDVAVNSQLIASHAYSVDAVNVDKNGNVISLTLRNPWGCDMNGMGNGYVTVSAAEAFKSFTGICAATV